MGLSSPLSVMMAPFKRAWAELTYGLIQHVLLVLGADGAPPPELRPGASDFALS